MTKMAVADREDAKHPPIESGHVVVGRDLDVY
jgi:hypothetical protein